MNSVVTIVVSMDILIMLSITCGILIGYGIKKPKTAKKAKAPSLPKLFKKVEKFDMSPVIPDKRKKGVINEVREQEEQE